MGVEEELRKGHDLGRAVPPVGTMHEDGDAAHFNQLDDLRKAEGGGLLL
jgi:hypothetical protein